MSELVRMAERESALTPLGTEMVAALGVEAVVMQANRRCCACSESGRNDSTPAGRFGSGMFRFRACRAEAGVQAVGAVAQAVDTWLRPACLAL